MAAVRPYVIALVALLVAFGIVCTLAPRTLQSAAPDVTAMVERLGSPFVKGAYARNVWDMQSFGGRVYLAHGNSVNRAPDPNAGPVPLVSYDPATGAFSAAATLEEEQIRRFRVIDGRLYVPGDDPRAPGSPGSFYRLDDGEWSRVATIPGAVHTFDLVRHAGQLFAAIGSESPGTVVVSDDEGKTWRSVLAEPGYILNLFSFKGQLYALWFLYPSDTPAESKLYRYDGRQFVPAGVAGAQIAPQAPQQSFVYLSRLVEYAGQLVYIAYQEDADYRPQPYALYVAPALEQARRVVLPVAGAAPFDLLQRDGALYVLGAAPRPGGGHTVLIFQSADLHTWSELFRFEAATFARSFEELDGDFYLGLGTTSLALAPASGDILRVREAAYSPPGAPPTSAPVGPAPARVILPLVKRP